MIFSGRQARISNPDAPANLLNPTKQESFRYPDEVDKARREIARRHEMGWDVYFGVHLFGESDTRRGSHAVPTVSVLWLDEDDGHYPDEGPQPTAIVRSSKNRRHLYWQLTRAIPINEAVKLCKRIAACSNGDRGKAAKASVLRVPGTSNFKRYPDVDPVTVEFTGVSAWEPETLEQAIPPLPEPEPKPRREYNGNRPGDFNLQSWLEWHEVRILGEVPDDQGVKYAIVCPWVEEHTGGDYSGTFAGRYAGDGATWFKCHHDHCHDRGWREFREEIAPRANVRIKAGSPGPGDTDPEEGTRRRIDRAWEGCRDLAHRDDLTTDFAKDLHRSGVAGEKRQMRLLYLALTSRCLDKPVSVAVKGPSSGGKSVLVEKVLGGFPESAFYALTAMSERALIYLDEDMRHRFLVIYEASGMAGDMQTYLMRTLLSENRIRYQTAESTSKGVRPRLLELEGPTGLIVTTTQTRMHPENETRLFSLLVTDDRNQTKAIFRAIADQDREPVDMEVWRDLQTWIEGEPCEVYIPYAGALAELVPPVAVRLRRDFPAVLQLIRAHAVLHQASRERDDKGRIVATFEDYRIVRELVADLVSEGVDAAVNPTVRETVEAVKKLTADIEDEEDRHVSNKQIAKALNLHTGQTSRRVKSARDGGYLVNLEDRKGKPARIALGEPLPADIVILPTVEKLTAEWDRCGVAPSFGGRGGSTENEPESVAFGKRNGPQHRNTFDPKSDENSHKRHHSDAEQHWKVPTYQFWLVLAPRIWCFGKLRVHLRAQQESSLISAGLRHHASRIPHKEEGNCRTGLKNPYSHFSGRRTCCECGQGSRA